MKLGRSFSYYEGGGNFEVYMRKKRNHYVPRFLLNNFASKSKDGKYWVWQYRKGIKPKEVSTKDLAVGTYFYGRNPDLEEAFAKSEALMKPVVRALIDGEDASAFVKELAAFVYLLAVRTRALRIQMADSTTDVAAELFGEENLENINKALRKEAELMYDRELGRFLASLPKSQRKSVLKRARREFPKERFLREADSALARLNSAAILQLFKCMTEAIDFQTAVESGQLQALTKLLMTDKTPDPLLRATWELVVDASADFVLGDSCVLASNSHGDFGSLLRFGAQEWDQLYLPLTPRHLLVARKTARQSLSTPGEINSLSALLAENAIFSSSKNVETEELAKQIGSGDSLINKSQIKELIEFVWQDLAG